MVRRNLTSEPGAPSPALVQTALTPGRATPSAQDKAIDEPPIAFPEYGYIAHSDFGAIARANLCETQCDHGMEIGRASCMAGVCQSVLISVGGVSLKKRIT